jgi:hypothetical protein
MSALVVLSLPAPARAAAGGPGPALCSFDVQDTATPGWLMTPSQGKAHGIGTMTCSGMVHGKQLNGEPGRFEWWYSYGSADVPTGANTCASAGGNGTWEVDLPTVEGPPLALTGSHTWLGTAVGEFKGQLGGLPVKMTYEGRGHPDHSDENCVTEPFSHIPTLGQGTVG